MNSKWTIDRNKFMTPGQVSKLRRTAEDLAIIGEKRKLLIAPRDWMIIDLALSTGLRVSEISNLKEEDIYIGNNEFELIVTKGKGGKRRTVYFDPHLKTHLKRYLIWKRSMGKSGDYLLFSKQSPRMCVESYERVFNKLRDKSEIPSHFSFHSMRHTYATQLYLKTRDLRLVQKQLGHSSPVITSLYADIIDIQYNRVFSNPLYLDRQVSKDRK
ncbi:MAG: site-specific integrase [Candidatus Marinimicrobia bacterium]|nr:site-specific integrase [Candidatus Neomarinimicrobiota bacterium]